MCQMQKTDLLTNKHDLHLQSCKSVLTAAEGHGEQQRTLICMAASATLVYQSSWADVWTEEKLPRLQWEKQWRVPLRFQEKYSWIQKEVKSYPNLWRRGSGMGRQKSPWNRGSQDTGTLACVTVEHPKGEVRLNAGFPTVTLLPSPRNTCSEPSMETATGRAWWSFQNLERPT